MGYYIWVQTGDPGTLIRELFPDAGIVGEWLDDVHPAGTPDSELESAILITLPGAGVLQEAASIQEGPDTRILAIEEALFVSLPIDELFDEETLEADDDDPKIRPAYEELMWDCTFAGIARPGDGWSDDMDLIVVEHSPQGAAALESLFSGLRNLGASLDPSWSVPRPP
jgi:hypothetical protein